MIRVIVLYPRSDTSTFDADYWVKTHMPLVGAKLASSTWEADVAGPDQPHHGIAHISFPDMEAFGAAMGSAGMGEVAADIANYTNVAPQLYVSEVAAKS